MRVLLSLAILLAAVARAQDSADESAIRLAIAMLNEALPPDGLFTADSDARSAVEQLWKDKRLRFRTRPRPPGRPTVVISHEPWGEARIDWPGAPIVVVVNPRIESRSIRFLTPDVALADAVCDYNSQLTPLLVILRKEGAGWKIASLRIVAVAMEAAR